MSNSMATEISCEQLRLCNAILEEIQPVVRGMRMSVKNVTH